MKEMKDKCPCGGELISKTDPPYIVLVCATCHQVVRELELDFEPEFDPYN